VCFGASFDDGYQNRLEAVENVGHGLLPVEEAPMVMVGLPT
jgi:hypothetical protein